MSPSTTAALLRHRVRIGPRSPLLLYALVLPFIATFLIRGVFGDLFADEPRVGGRPGRFGGGRTSPWPPGSAWCSCR